MKVKIEFIAELPDIDCTDEELEEFLRFELGDNGRMNTNNPFNGNIVKPIFGTFEWEEA